MTIYAYAVAFVLLLVALIAVGAAIELVTAWRTSRKDAARNRHPSARRRPDALDEAVVGNGGEG